MSRHEAFVILAHRGNVRGRSAAVLENAYDHCAQALELGFGLEVDVRRSSHGHYYMSHDVTGPTPERLLGRYSELFRRHPTSVIAVNAKEIWPPASWVGLYKDAAFGPSSFFFDFELLEPANPGQTQRAIRGLPDGAAIQLAARVSDRGESVRQCLSIPAQFVWADEMDRPWILSSDIERLRQADRRVFVVSPELHGGDDDARIRRWREFKRWHIAGICTDFAIEAGHFFNS